MGYRLSKIYTRTGDQGTTGLGDGNRVRKDHPRIGAIGAVDELNSVLGLLLTYELPDHVRRCLDPIQHRLFDLGGELSIPGYRMLGEDHVRALEASLDTLNESLPPLEEFILPGGSRAAAVCHLARTVCRRAERCLVSLTAGGATEDLGDEGRSGAAADAVSGVALKYLNRLSDLLFVMARAINRWADAPEVLWKKSTPEGNAGF